MHRRVASLLFATALLAGLCLHAGEPPPKLRRPAPLILPQVKFQNADLSGALETLRQAAEKQSGGALKVTFALDLPKDYKPPSELTLELHAVPFSEALRCIGDLAGVDFSAQGNAIAVRARRTPTAAAPPAPAPPSSPAVASAPAPTPAKGLTGALGKPPERVGNGVGVRRAMDGAVQPEQSGHMAHRALDGWSTDMEIKHVFDANCVRVATCPAAGCGCSQCSCKKAPDK